MILMEKNIRYWIIILFFSLFLCLNVFLGDFESMSDGFTRLGFPFVFLQSTGGKCEDCGSLNWFSWFHLIADVVICLALAIAIVAAVKRIRIR